MKINDLFLDFRITSRCNIGCDLCFRTPGIKDESLNKILPIITKAFKAGFKGMGFTGGEPTTRTDYIEMIKHAKKCGFMTYLSTIGHDFIRQRNRLEGILDWIGLPIDGVDFATNSAIRSKFMGMQHEILQDIFNALSQNPTSIKIKLTTIVTKINIYELDSIISFVEKLPYKFDMWRFYQFCPVGIANEKSDKLAIDTKLFCEEMAKLTKQYSRLPISYATFEERDMANIIMEPNFDIIIPKGNDYKLLGNLQTDSEKKIISVITNACDDIIDRCLRNRNWMY